MKRLLLAALVVLLAGTAGAKVLVVTEINDPKASGGAESDSMARQSLNMQQRLIDACLDVFNTTGMDYDAVPVTAMRTRWLKDGRLVRNWKGSGGVGTDSSFTQYDAVIVLNAQGRYSISSVSAQQPWPPSETGCYVCSLTTAPSLYPRVPVLSLWGAMNGYSPFGTSNSTTYGMVGRVGSGAALCSTGVRVSANSGGGGAEPMLSYATTNRTSLWFSAANKYAYTGSAGRLLIATSAGGSRPLLCTRTPPHRRYLTNVWALARPPVPQMDINPDAGVDTVDAWERLFSTFAGTTYGGEAIPSNARMIYANIMGASPCGDSLEWVNHEGANNNVPCEFDGPTLLFVLAHLDSLTGGKVWPGTTSKLPLRSAVTIDGAFTRNSRNWSLGLADADSNIIKGSLDSLSALGIPVTVGVNVDSIASYPWEIAWWMKLHRLRVSPQAWVGVDRFLQVTNNQPPAVDTSTSAGSGNWSAARPVDVFGRYRNRLFYGTTGVDSSIYQGMLAIRGIANRYFPGQVSGLLMAPRDDYTPYRYFPQPLWVDSLVFIVRKAGFSAVRTDVQYRDADPARWYGDIRLLRGGVAKQCLVPDRLGGGEPLRFLGVNGYQNTGAHYQYILGGGHSNLDTLVALQEAYGAPVASSPPVPTMYMSRFYAGFLHDEFVDPDYFQQGYGFGDIGPPVIFTAGVWFPIEDHFSPSRRGNIFKITATELSGDPAAVAATRPGWWAIKSVKQSFDAINAAAGRSVCIFGWPEDIVP